MGKTKKPCPEQSRGISKKQFSVIEEMFTGGLDEQAVLDKYDVSRETFDKWLADERFIGKLNERIAHSFRQSRLIIARFAPMAASRLVQLTESENQETARKACLDVISMGSVSNKYLAPSLTGSSQDNTSDEITPDTASRILAALAEEKSVARNL